MNILHIILYSIVPIVVVMLVGYISGKRGVFTETDSQRFNKVVLDYALPAALFVSTVEASRADIVNNLKLTIAAIVGIMVCFMAVYYIFKYCFKKNTGADGAVSALISGSPSIGFLGFAVLEPIFGAGPSVAIVVAVVGIVVNAIGIPVGLSLINASLEQSTGEPKKENFWKPVLHALTQPVAWAPILAVVWVVIGIPWPEELSPSFNLIAKANASLAVFSAGITLSAVKISINRQVILGSVLKLIFMPAIVLLLGLLMQIDVLSLKMLVVACTLPPAFSGIIIANRYNTYVATGTSSLALSVLLFIGFAPLWLWLTDIAFQCL